MLMSRDREDEDLTRIVISFFYVLPHLFLSIYTVTMLRVSTCLLKKLDDDDNDDE